VDKLDTRLRFDGKVYNLLVDSNLGSDFGGVATTEALCDFSSTKAALETVSCDCHGGTGNCFKIDFVVPIVLGMPITTL
jgi:hypothetical protein